MHCDDVWLAGAADAQVAEDGFLASERFCFGDDVPGFALRQEGYGDALPDFGSEGEGGLGVEPLFLNLTRLGELRGQKFLRRAFGFVRTHGPVSPGNIAGTPIVAAGASVVSSSLGPKGSTKERGSYGAGL